MKAIIEDKEALFMDRQRDDEFCKSVRRLINHGRINSNDKHHNVLNKVRDDLWIDEMGILRKKINVKNRDPRNPAIAPASMRKAIIMEAHASPWAGHGAVFRTTERILEHFWWPTMFSEIRSIVKSCTICQLAKSPAPQKAPLQSLPVPSGPNQRVHMDLMGELKSLDEFKYILVVTDAYTKYTLVTPIKNKTAETVAKAFFESWIAQFSCPRMIVSDQGREFVNKTMEEMNKRLKISHNRTSSYHPESNSSAESFNRSIIKYMQIALENDTLKWSDWVKTLQISYNTTVHRTTKSTPFALTHAFLPTLPFFDLQRPRVYYGDNPGAETVTRLNKSFMMAKKNSEDAIAEQEKYYNLKSKMRDFKVGDDVMVHNKPYIKTQDNPKFEFNYEGPYKIIKQTAELNFIIKNAKRTREIHVNRLRHFKYSDLFDKNNEEINRRSSRQPSIRKNSFDNNDDEAEERPDMNKQNSNFNAQFPPLRRSSRINPPEDSTEEVHDSRIRNSDSENERKSNDVITPLPDLSQTTRRRSLLIKRELITPPSTTTTTRVTAPPALTASGSPVNVTAGRTLPQVQPRNVTATPLPAESGSPVATTVSAPFKAKTSSRRTVTPPAQPTANIPPPPPSKKPPLIVKTVLDSDFSHSGTMIKDRFKAKNAAMEARSKMKRTVSVGGETIKQRRALIKAASPTKPKSYIGEDRLESMRKLNQIRKEERQRKEKRRIANLTTPDQPVRRPSITSAKSSASSNYSTPMTSDTPTAATGAIPKQSILKKNNKDAGGSKECISKKSESTDKSNYPSGFSKLTNVLLKRSEKPQTIEDTPKSSKNVDTRPLRSNYNAPAPKYISTTVEKEVKKLQDIKSSINSRPTKKQL